MPGKKKQPNTQAKRRSGLEREVMRFLWEQGPSTAEEVRVAVGKKRQLTDSTIRTVLRRLEAKDLVRHDVEDRLFRYRAIQEPGKVAAETVRGLIQNLCNGSLKELLVGMVEHSVVDSAELRRLAQEIEARKMARDKSEEKS